MPVVGTKSKATGGVILETECSGSIREGDGSGSSSSRGEGSEEVGVASQLEVAIVVDGEFGDTTG